MTDPRVESKLADVLGELAGALAEFEEARPLMAQKHTREAWESAQELQEVIEDE